MDLWRRVSQGMSGVALPLSASTQSMQFPVHRGVTSSYFVVPRGQLTFDAEGVEQPGSIYHSRIPHVPGGNSGITIGRGFDLGTQSPTAIHTFLTQAGFTVSFINQAVAAAGLRGREAVNFLETSPSLGEIGQEQQWKLFNLTYQSMSQDVKRLSDKPDTVKRYGAVNWESLDPGILDLVTDLRYRGDYTPETRLKIQPYLVRNDIDGLATVIEDRDYWVTRHNVPPMRFNQRRDYVSQILIR